MNTHAHVREDAAVVAFLPRCRVPGCPNRVHEPWEATGTLCSRCALEGELFDREARAGAWDLPEVRRLHN